MQDEVEQTDGDLRAQALNMWANYIETSNPILSARDATEQKLPFKALDDSQKRLVLRLRKLAINELMPRRKENVLANPKRRG